MDQSLLCILTVFCCQPQKAGGAAAVKSVELRGSGADGWKPMNNVWGATWEVPQAPKPPLTLRIIDDQDNSVRSEPHQP